METNEYDINKTAAALGITPEVVAGIIKEMLSSVDEHITRMKSLLQQQNFEELGRTAHKLKGMVANLRFENMAALAKSIEGKARAGSRDGYRELISDIEKAFLDMKKTADSL